MRLLASCARTCLRSALRTHPVLYLFSGGDLWTAQDLFPESSRFTMVSALPLGDLNCYLSEPCRKAAVSHVNWYFNHWRDRHYSWTETVLMEKWLRDYRVPSGNQSVGVLPLLLLSLHAHGHELHDVVQTASAHSVTLVTDRGTSVQYASYQLGRQRQPLSGARSPEHGLLKDLRVLDHVLNRSTSVTATTHATTGRSSSPYAVQSPRLVCLIKAAESAWQLTSRPAFQDWLLPKLDAAVSDETGLQLSAFTSEWRVRAFGQFEGLERAYADRGLRSTWDQVDCHDVADASAACAERKRLAQQMRADVVRRFTGAPLPFVFGYGHQKIHGVLLAAWRLVFDDS